MHDSYISEQNLQTELFNGKGITSFRISPASEPSELPNKLFFLSAFDLGKYITIAEMN